MQNHFSIKLIHLDTKVNELSLTMGRLSAKKIERKLNTINATLELLFDYASLHNIDIDAFHHRLVGINTRIINIQNFLNRKRRPIWKKLLGLFAGVIDFITRIIGFNFHLRDRLEYHDAKLLAYEW